MCVKLPTRCGPPWAAPCGLRSLFWHMRNLWHCHCRQLLGHGSPGTNRETIACCNRSRTSLRLVSFRQFSSGTDDSKRAVGNDARHRFRALLGALRWLLVSIGRCVWFEFWRHSSRRPRAKLRSIQSQACPSRVRATLKSIPSLSCP